VQALAEAALRRELAAMEAEVSRAEATEEEEPRRQVALEQVALLESIVARAADRTEQARAQVPLEV
jgi:hypothetical protein